ncbi:MAG TPA: DUF58 domain-containing protein [Candidatus Binatia bacterium]|nr:DUF58 domain-containing protein [Candidatus Binatia bacterium]
MPAAARLKDRFFARRFAGEEDPFDPRLLSRLDRIRFRFGTVHGARAGETPVRGLTQESGIEVESFKSYAAGDDIRYLDWNAVGRLDQLLTRRFVAEREVPVHLLLDASASMAVPMEDRKFGFGVRLAGALAYIALNGNDPVRIAALRGGSRGAEVEESPLLRHRGRYLRLKPFLSALKPAGGTALLEGVSRYLEVHRERGVAVVISDFLVSQDLYERALQRLQARRLQVQAVQIVGREERAIASLGGRLRLRDSETGAVRDVVLTAADRHRYAAAFGARTEGLRSFCHRSSIGHAVVSADSGVAHCLTHILPAGGMLRLR